MVILILNVTRLIIILVYKSEIIDCGKTISDHLPITCILDMPNMVTQCVSTQPSCIKPAIKEMWDKADLLTYFNTTGLLLHTINIPTPTFASAAGCDWIDYYDDITRYYNSIVDSLSSASRISVPRIPFKCLKPFWSDDLDRLKEASIYMHSLWCQCGKPRFGVINSARLKAKYDYKCAIKQAAADYETVNADEISDHLLNKDTTKFW